MKKLLIGVLALTAMSTYATTGISCRGVDSTLEIYTTEALMAGNNLLRVDIEAPFLSDSTITLERSDSNLVVDREVGPSQDEIVYTASNSQLSLTLKIESEDYMGMTVSEAILTYGGEIYNEYVVCN